MDKIKKYAKKTIELAQKNREVISYLFFGGCTTLVNIIVYFIASKIGLGTTPATILAWFLSVLFAYLTNRFFVFENRAHGFGRIAKECSSFFAARLTTGILDLLIMLVFVDFFKYNDMLIKILSNIIVIAANYFLSKLWIFREKNAQDSKSIKRTIITILNMVPALVVVMFSAYIFMTMMINVRIDKTYTHFDILNRLQVSNKEIIIYPIILIALFVAFIIFFSKKRNTLAFTNKLLLWTVGILSILSIVFKSWFLIAIVLIGIACLIFRRGRISSLSDKHFIELILFSFLCVLILQLFITSNIWFKTDWDVEVIVNNAERIALQGVTEPEEWYFGVYPNNTVLVYTLVVLFNIGKVFLKHPYQAVLIGSSLFVCISVLLATLCIYKMTKNRTVTVIGMLIGTALIALNPWIVIPYSDTFGMLFPILSLFFYLHIRNKYVKYFAVASTLFIGYLYKPTILIFLMALIMLGVVKCIIRLLEKKFPTKKVACLALAFIMAFGFSILFENIITYKNQADYDDNREFGVMHFFMMGSNSESDGIWSADDYNFSSSFPDKESRNKANFEKAISRIKEMGFKGYAKHLIRKNLINYNDGSFSWAKYGVF